VKEPDKTNMVIFRENSEDIYAGIEWEAESRQGQEAHQVPAGGNGRQEDPLPGHLGHRHQAGVREGTERLVRKAIQYAIDNDKPSRDHRAQGQHHEVHRRRLPRLGYALAQKEFGASLIDGGPWCKFKNPKTGKDIVVKDASPTPSCSRSCCVRPSTA
jgi:isocitrate dehydrogenase